MGIIFYLYMCFSQNGSLAIGLFGLFFSVSIYSKNRYASIGLGYFSLMEILQYFQYQVIDECHNPTNRFLTDVAYIHICFQPLFFNLWLFAFTKNPPFLFLYMSFLAGLLLISRLFFVKDDNSNLCDTKHEPLCGKLTCSFSGEKHIAWNIRLRNTDYITPSIFLHFFMWTIPILTLFQIKPVIALILTGPYLAYVTNNIHEQPAIWCYTAIAQVILTYFLIL